MGKRLYDDINRRLYQYKDGGSYYTLVGRKETSLETTDRQEAIDRLEVTEARVSRFGMRAHRAKVSKLFPEFLRDKKKDVRASTHKDYVEIWDRYFAKFFGRYVVADINQKSWAVFCSRQKGTSDFQNHRNLMHQFLKWCEMNEFTNGVPTLQNPKHKRRKRKIIPPQHLRLIFQHAHGSLLLFLAMALFMGMRRSEIMRARWTKIDFDRRSLKLEDEDVKTGDGREIPITQVVLNLLSARLLNQIKARIQTPWVFPHKDDPARHGELGGLMPAWRRCLLNAGFARKVPAKNAAGYKIVVDYTWHDLRATFEKHTHMSKDFNDTQREKMAGAAIDVQRKIYVSMDADDLRGIEEVVSKNIPTLVQDLSDRNKDAGKTLGSNADNSTIEGASGEKS